MDNEEDSEGGSTGYEKKVNEEQKKDNMDSDDEQPVEDNEDEAINVKMDLEEDEDDIEVLYIKLKVSSTGILGFTTLSEEHTEESIKDLVEQIIQEESGLGYVPKNNHEARIKIIVKILAELTEKIVPGSGQRWVDLRPNTEIKTEANVAEKDDDKTFVIEATEVDDKTFVKEATEVEDDSKENEAMFTEVSSIKTNILEWAMLETGIPIDEANYMCVNEAGGDVESANESETNEEINDDGASDDDGSTKGSMKDEEEENAKEDAKTATENNNLYRKNTELGENLKKKEAVINKLEMEMEKMKEDTVALRLEYKEYTMKLENALKNKSRQQLKTKSCSDRTETKTIKLLKGSSPPRDIKKKDKKVDEFTKKKSLSHQKLGSYLRRAKVVKEQIARGEEVIFLSQVKAPGMKEEGRKDEGKKEGGHKEKGGGGEKRRLEEGEGGGEGGGKKRRGGEKKN